MAIADSYRHEKRASADRFAKNPIGTLRACLAGDPVTFQGLVLIAVGPLEARKIRESPTDAELGWIARELLSLLRAEDSDRMPRPDRALM